MSASRRLARFNRAVGNRIVGSGLARMPGFGAIVHRGRRSGREYRTPVKVFRSRDGYVISLPYGPESDWVQNVVMAGGCELVTRGRRVRLAEPRVFAGGVPASIPAPLRMVLKQAGVSDFIELRPVADNPVTRLADR